MLTDRLHPGHAVLAALALACAVLAWRALVALQSPLPLPPPFFQPTMADRALLSRFDPFFPSRAASGDSLPVTALPFSLHGVRADSATGRGSAIIASGDGQQTVYAVGDPISDGVTLVAIAADHVVLERGGVREALWLDSAGGEAVQRYDPNATQPYRATPEDPTGDTINESDSPAAASVPTNAPANAPSAAEMPAVPANQD